MSRSVHYLKSPFHVVESEGEILHSSNEETNTLLTAKNFKTLKQEASEWCFAHGLILYENESTHGLLKKTVPAPISLFPSPFPRKWYQWANDIQPLFNILIDRISQHETFLTESLIK
jgi:hypothetical protein